MKSLIGQSAFLIVLCIVCNTSDATAQDSLKDWHLRGSNLAFKDSWIVGSLPTLVDAPDVDKRIDFTHLRRVIQQLNARSQQNRSNSGKQLADRLACWAAESTPFLNDSLVGVINNTLSPDEVATLCKTCWPAISFDYTDVTPELGEALIKAIERFGLDKELENWLTPLTAAIVSRDSSNDKALTLLIRQLNEAGSKRDNWLYAIRSNDPRWADWVIKAVTDSPSVAIIQELGSLRSQDDTIGNILNQLLKSDYAEHRRTAGRELLDRGECTPQVRKMLDSILQRGRRSYESFPLYSNDIQSDCYSKYLVKKVSGDIIGVSISANDFFVEVEILGELATNNAAARSQLEKLASHTGNRPEDKAMRSAAASMLIVKGLRRDSELNNHCHELIRTVFSDDGFGTPGWEYEPFYVSALKALKAMEDSRFAGDLQFLLTERLHIAQSIIGAGFFSNSLLELIDSPLNLSETLQIVGTDRDNRAYRAFAYIVSGGNLNVFFTLVSDEDDWIALAQATDYETAHRTLVTLPAALQIIDSLDNYRSNFHAAAARFIAVKENEWKDDDWKIIAKIPGHMKNSSAEASIRELVTRHESLAILFEILRWIGIHAIFWSVLILLYPRYRFVQSVFFWNKWVRKILGIVYVEILLIYVPYLRRILLSPFKDSFLKDADLDNFDPQAYFSDVNVTDPLTARLLTVQELRYELKGQTIIEGASGLGKTMLLRSLIVDSRRRVSVFIQADRCSEGVIAAIRKCVFGFADDDAFLTRLIYSGALDIYVDGINEVTAETRAQIKDFCERFIKCQIVISTQPMEWRKPTKARVFRICPLQKDKIISFLHSQKDHLPPDAVLTGDAFETRCSEYINKELPAMSTHTREESVLKILSNPMDLTFVVTMLALGKTPNLFMLQRQQFEVMSDDFQKRNNNKPFPLKRFSEMSYKMRCDDVVEIAAGPYAAELIAMEKFKMVYRRVSDQKESQWYFRHDKIMEFFIVQSFLGQGNELIAQHLGEARFSGVYFLLGYLLPIEEAESLERRLIYYSADNHDHSVSDHFIQILRSRKAS